MTVAETLTDDEYSFSQVPVLFGTPPQEVDLTINLSGDLLAAWSIDCVYCAGSQSFDEDLSSTFNVKIPSLVNWK